MAELLQRGIKLAASLPAHLAFHWGQLPVVSGVIERRGENSLRRRLCIPVLLPKEADVVAGLDRYGVWETDIGALSLDAPMLGNIVSCGMRLAEEVVSRVGNRPATRRAMTTASPGELMRYPAIYRWGLSAVLLRIAEAYLRRPVAYDGAQLHYSPPDGQEIGTRRWHLDREDGRMIKVALYLNPVDEDGGPFQILQQEARRQDGRFRYPIMTDAQLRAHLGPQRVTNCTGEAGTMVFADTARFYHRGKPATARPRAAIFFSYFSRPPCHPYFCGRSRLSRRQIVTLAAGLHPTQLASALWRDELTLPSRLVPVSAT